MLVCVPSSFQTSQQEPPSTLLESAPPKPQLNLLVIDDQQMLQMPESLTKAWYHDQKFGARFAEEFSKAVHVRSSLFGLL